VDGPLPDFFGEFVEPIEIVVDARLDAVPLLSGVVLVLDVGALVEAHFGGVSHQIS
jgi:hypothetical protein